MNRAAFSVASSYAIEVSKSLEAARLFQAKHDPALEWDVDYHARIAEEKLDGLCRVLGFRLVPIAAPVKEVA